MTARATSTPGRAPPPSAATGPPRAPRRPPSRSWWSLAGTAVVYAGLAVLFLTVAGATFLLVAPPVDMTRDRVTAEFHARTGYVLELNGATSLKLLPTPSIEFRDVVVATAEKGGAPVLRVEAVEIEAMLWPLLRGKVQAGRIALKRPQLDLVVGEDGRRRWLRAEHEPVQAHPVRVAQVVRDGNPGRFSMPALQEDDEKLAPVERRGRKRVEALEAGDLKIQIFDGIVRYRDLRSGSLTQADQIQVRLSRRDGRKEAPLKGRGSLAYNGEAVKFDITTELGQGTGRGLEKLSLRFSGRHGSGHYDGAVGFADQPLLSGRLDLSTPSVSEAGRWLGMRLRDSAGLAGAVALKGRIEAQEGHARIEEMHLKVAGIEAGGHVEVVLARRRPRFAADLVFAELDFDRIRASRETTRSRRSEERERSRKVRRVEASRAPPPVASNPQTSASAEEPQETQGREGRGPREWRTDPIAFANLSGADGDARLRAARVVWRGAVLTDAVGALSLSDGAMKIDIREGALHGGSARGVITASAAGHVGIDLALDGVSALETLGNAGRFEVLDGPARIRLAVAGHGASEQEIVGTLTGTASLEIAEGAILGWSVAEIIASVRRLELPNLDRNPSARTPFSRLSAALTIKDGIATGKDMRIAASPISLDSAGAINLPARTLDLTLNPRPADAAQTGSASRMAGLTVPLQLQGPWHRPRLRGDYQSILKSPQKVIEGVRGTARGIKDEDIDKAAKRLLGDTPEAEKGAKRAKELLKRFLDN
jgi:AsmA protein